MSDPERASPSEAGPADAAPAPAAARPDGPAPKKEPGSGASSGRPPRVRGTLLPIALTAIALVLSIVSFAAWSGSRSGTEEPPGPAAAAPVSDPAPAPREPGPRVADPAPSEEALRAAGRREIERALKDDPEEAWLYIEEIERALGRDERAGEARRRREALAEKRLASEAFADEMRKAASEIDVAGLGPMETTLAAATAGRDAPDFPRTRVILWSMLSRSGDLSGRIGSIAPDIMMAIADSYRDEALLAREGEKGSDTPPDARIVEPKSAEEKK